VIPGGRGRCGGARKGPGATTSGLDGPPGPPDSSRATTGRGPISRRQAKQGAHMPEADQGRRRRLNCRLACTVFDPGPTHRCTTWVDRPPRRSPSTRFIEAHSHRPSGAIAGEIDTEGQPRNLVFRPGAKRRGNKAPGGRSTAYRATLCSPETSPRPGTPPRPHSPMTSVGATRGPAAW